MRDGARDRGIAVAIVVLAWAGLYLPALGALEFKGEEARRVLPAITMLETGRWIVPEVGGADYFNKPPMINWMVAASFAVTGSRSEWAARLPSTLGVLAFALLLVAGPCSWLNARARLLGALVFLTNISILSKGRLIEIEASYVAMTGLVTWWWVSRRRDGAGPWEQWLPVALVLAAGVLLKGPFIGMLFYLTVACVLVEERRLRELLTLPHLVSIGLAAALVLTWVWLAHLETSGEAMRSRWQSELGKRLVLSEENLDHWGWSVLKTLRNLVPWVVFLPLMWRRAWVERIPAEDRGLFLALRRSLVLGFVLMNLMPGTLARYSLPVFPLASVLLGWTLSTSRTALPSDRVVQWAMVACGLFVSAFALSCAFLPGVDAAGLLLATLVLIGVLLLVRYRERIRGPVIPSVVGTGIAVAAILVAAKFVIPVARTWETLRPAGEAVTRIVPAGETVHVYDPGYAAFLFYVRSPLAYVLDPEDVDHRVRYLLVGGEELDELQSASEFAAREHRLLHRLPDRIRGDFHLLELRPTRVAAAPE